METEYSGTGPVGLTVEHSFGCYYSVVVEYFATVAVVHFVVDYLLEIADCKSLELHTLDFGQAAFVGLDIVDFELAAGVLVDFGQAAGVVAELGPAAGLTVEFGLAAEVFVAFGIAAGVVADFGLAAGVTVDFG